jgi:chromosome segregation ATPase
LGTDIHGNITRLNNALAGMAETLERCQAMLALTEKQLAEAKEEVKIPFGKEGELKEKLARLAELNALLNMHEKVTEVIGEPEPERETSLQRAQKELEYAR